jgi:hypothetical protein
MKKAWNALFGHSKNFGEYRGVDRRDHLAQVDFLRLTGVPLGAMDGTRQSRHKTGEFGLDD